MKHNGLFSLLRCGRLNRAAADRKKQSTGTGSTFVTCGDLVCASLASALSPWWRDLCLVSSFPLSSLDIGAGSTEMVASSRLWLANVLILVGARIRHMEMAFLVPLLIAFVVPTTRDVALQLVHMWLDSRAIIRELFDPIISRLKSAAKDGDPNVSTDLLTDMEIDSEEYDSHAEQREWHQSGSDAARLGFGLVFCYMLQVPFLGPFAWFMGFASAGLFAPELVDLSSFSGSSKKTT
ncbi:unnamed protein product [Phytophthora fragariaefolia]|uniref:Unnamed protein product n=1 Tax=Phytophthora fragariaefolia TaxID=1490495 RepID=A0A9W6XLT2_9STRA|nr:unnamed protein product [Phytophthora fragariaefolia]